MQQMMDWSTWKILKKPVLIINLELQTDIIQTLDPDITFLEVNTFSIPLPVKPSDKSYYDDHHYCCDTQQDALYEQLLQEYRSKGDAETADESTCSDGKEQRYFFHTQQVPDNGAPDAPAARDRHHHKHDNAGKIEFF